MNLLVCNGIHDEQVNFLDVRNYCVISVNLKAVTDYSTNYLYAVNLLTIF